MKDDETSLLSKALPISGNAFFCSKFPRVHQLVILIRVALRRREYGALVE
jgi:hypothetical protein